MQVQAAATKSMEVVVLGHIESYVPQRLVERGWSARDLFREAAKIDAEISLDSCYRAASGSADLNLRTVNVLCAVFDEPIERLFYHVKDEQPG